MNFLLEILLVLIMLELVRRWIIKALELEEKNRRLQDKLSAMEKLYGEMKGEIEITKKYRHDMKKHIHLLEGLLEKYNDTEIESDVVWQRESCEVLQKNLYCNNIFIDTICTLKKKQCTEKGIDLSVDIQIENFVPMKEIDISGLFQNLLDNAIEASEQVENPSERKISLSICEKQVGWYLIVKNTCVALEEIDFRTKKRDQENHGYGIEIIREIVNKYDGIEEYIKDVSDNQVTVKVFFPRMKKM